VIAVNEDARALHVGNVGKRSIDKRRTLNMKYVYVVMTGCVGDYHINSIQSSKEKGDKRKQELKEDKRYHGDVWVEKWEVK